MKILLMLCAMTALGCGDSSSSNASKEADPSRTEDTNQSDKTNTEYVDVVAGPYTLAPGEEKYFCYTSTLKEDVIIDGFSYESSPSVHHLVMSQSMEKVEDGFEECNVLFRSSWSPLYITGTGNAPMEAPEGAGYKLEAGTQIVVQLHLLNATAKEVTEELVVKMRKSPLQEVERVGVVVFGSMSMSLPPNQTSDVVGACDTPDEVRTFAAFPHMHYKGRTMVVEVGDDEDSLKEVYRRDPYDFDDQSMDEFELTIKKGSRVRVTCSYDNDTDQVVTYGESSTEEMCFFIAFATGTEDDFSGCLGSTSFFPEGCGDEPPNEKGLGAKCTKGGGECTNGFQCTLDLIEDTDLGLCVGINNCEVSADCGSNAICCSPTQAATVKLCVPESCAIPGCNPL